MDLTLIRRSQAGDEQAFAALFEQYKHLVFRTAYLMLDNAHDAEDVLQDVFVRVHRSLGSYQAHKGAFSTWLHRITVNQCLNWRRRWRFSLALDEVPENRLVAAGLTEDQRAEAEHLRQAVRRLSGKQRAIVVLRYYWDLSYAELAEILDLPLGTVKSRLNLALRNLRLDLDSSSAAPAAPVKDASK